MKSLKPKIYLVTLAGERLLVRASTKQGAVAHAVARLVTCEYADQNTLYELTKAGVEVVDSTADPAQPRLPGVDLDASPFEAPATTQ